MTSRGLRFSKVRHRPAVVGTCLCFIIITVEAKPGSAQEIVGKRQFSDQLVVSEPFVEDELEFPSILHILRPRRGDAPRAQETQIGAELKKRLTPDFEISLAGGFTDLSPDGKPTVTGFDNLEVGLKYQFLRDPSREAVASIALSWEVGGTGRAAGRRAPRTSELCGLGTGSRSESRPSSPSMNAPARTSAFADLCASISTVSSASVLRSRYLVTADGRHAISR